MHAKNVEDIIKGIHKRILKEIENFPEIEYSPAWPIEMHLDKTGRYYIHDPRWGGNIIEGNLDEKMINEFKRRAILRSLFHILGGKMEGYAIILGDGKVFVREDGRLEIENPEGVKIKKEIPESISPKIREGVYDALYWIWARILEEEIKKIKKYIHQLEKKWDYLYILYLEIYSSGLA